MGAVVVAHGLGHLPGAAKGLGWSAVSALPQPISPVTGVAWLVAALVVVVAGVLLAASAPRWWVVCAVAALVSQAAVVTSWSDAEAGTVVNVLLLAAAVYGWAAQGSRSFDSEYRRQVSAALSMSPPPPPSGLGPVVDNTYGPHSCRLFSMDARLHGVPVDVLHVFVGGAATMRVRAAS